jgi:serine/threonine protein kinase
MNELMEERETTGADRNFDASESKTETGANREAEDPFGRVAAIWGETVELSDAKKTCHSTAIVVKSPPPPSAPTTDSSDTPKTVIVSPSSPSPLPPPSDGPSRPFGEKYPRATSGMKAFDRGPAEAPKAPKFASNERPTGCLELNAEGSVAAVESFHVEQELGRGGMGVVRLAYQESLLREVAIKTLKEHAPPDSKEADVFFREAFVTGALTHPNIVPVHLYGRDARGRPFMVMKRVRGHPWDHLLRETTRKSTADSEKTHADGQSARSGSTGFSELTRHLEIFLKVCDAVSFAHAHGVIHLDLKPSNVMIGDHGEVTVMDWGLARYVTGARAEKHKDGLTHAGVVLAGTPAYMAPEMALGDLSRIGTSTDIYLLGGSLFEIATGRPPHTGRTPLEVVNHAARGELDSFSPRMGLPREGRALERIIRRALAATAEKRYPSVEALQDDIRAFLAGQGDRHESELLVREGRQELEILRTETELLRVVSPYYPRCTELLAKVARAQALWNLNPRATRLRRETLHFYADLALRGRDWGLAESLLRDLRLTGAEGVTASAPLESRLREERRKWERREYLLDRAARAGALAALLFAVVIIILIFLLSSMRSQLEAKISRESGGASGRAAAGKRQTASAFERAQVAFRRAPRTFTFIHLPPVEEAPYAELQGLLPMDDGVYIWDKEGRFWRMRLGADVGKTKAGASDDFLPFFRVYSDDERPVATARIGAMPIWLDPLGRVRGLAVAEKKEIVLFAPASETMANSGRPVALTFSGETGLAVFERLVVQLQVAERNGQTILTEVRRKILAEAFSPLSAAAYAVPVSHARGILRNPFLVVGRRGFSLLDSADGREVPVIGLQGSLSIVRIVPEKGLLRYWTYGVPETLGEVDFEALQKKEYRIPIRHPTAMAVSPDGRWTILGDDFGRLTLVTAINDLQVEQERVFDRSVAAVTFDENGRRIFAMEFGGENRPAGIGVWDVAKFIAPVPTSRTEKTTQTPYPHPLQKSGR